MKQISAYITPETARHIRELARMWGMSEVRNNTPVIERAIREAYERERNTEMDAEQIKQAVSEKRAVLRWSHGNWENVARLIVYQDAETAAMEAERDTRGKCWSMADEVWSELATDPIEAIKANLGLLRYS